MNFIVLHNMDGMPFALNIDSVIGYRPSVDGSHVVFAIKEDDTPREFLETFEEVSSALRAIAASFITFRS